MPRLRARREARAAADRALLLVSGCQPEGRMAEIGLLQGAPARQRRGMAREESRHEIRKRPARIDERRSFREADEQIFTQRGIAKSPMKML